MYKMGSPAATTTSYHACPAKTGKTPHVGGAVISAGTVTVGGEMEGVEEEMQAAGEEMQAAGDEGVEGVAGASKGNPDAETSGGLVVGKVEAGD